MVLFGAVKPHFPHHSFYFLSAIAIFRPKSMSFSISTKNCVSLVDIKSEEIYAAD